MKIFEQSHQSPSQAEHTKTLSQADVEKIATTSRFHFWPSWFIPNEAEFQLSVQSFHPIISSQLIR